MIAPATDPIGIEALEPMAAFGFDYIELSLAHLAALEPPAFARLVRRLEGAGLRCEACNNFFPAHLRLTGPAARPREAAEYAKGALERAASLGAAIIVFGSSGAKNIPPGFPEEEAFVQVTRLLQTLATAAQPLGLTIAIEPISRPEANFILRTADALRLVHAVDHPAVQLLIDYYHLAREGEGPGILEQAGGALRHIHFARVEGRRFPTAWDEDNDAFFDRLGALRYAGRCSIEAFTADFAADAPRALALLREAGRRIPEWSS